MSEIKIETTSAIFYFKDGILVCEIKPELIIDIRTAKRIVEDRINISNGKITPLLTVLHQNYLLLDKEAFRYFGSKRGVEGLSASAIVIDSPLQKILTNFSLLFYNQEAPFRLFTQLRDAQLWLFQSINQESQIDF